MTHPFKIGQSIRFIRTAQNEIIARRLGLDIEQAHKVSMAHSLNGMHFVQLLGSNEVHHNLNVFRFETEEEWGKRQVPASPEKAAAIDSALGINRAEGAFNPKDSTGARQRAWDEYAASRAKANLIARVNTPRWSGFMAGFEAGKQAATVTGSAVPLAALLRPLSRAGEAAPAITKGKVLKIADAILMDLQANGPATAAKIAERIGRPLNSVSPRFAQLVRGDRIHVAAGVGNRSVYKFGKRD